MMASKSTVDPTSLRVRKGTVDIITMDTADEQFRYILVYKDLATDYVHLRPITLITPKEIGLELVKIFMNFGPPNIMYFGADENLYTQIGTFINTAIPEKVNVMLAQSFADDTNKIKTKMLAWIYENDCQSWALACYVVQWALNNTKHLGVSPYEKLFSEEKTIGSLMVDDNVDIDEKMECNELTDLEKQLEADMVIVDRCCVNCRSVTFGGLDCDRCNKPVHSFCTQKADGNSSYCLPCIRKELHLAKLKARAIEIDTLLRFNQ